MGGGVKHMTLRSVIIRILYGPTIRRQACFIVTEEILNYNVFYQQKPAIKYWILEKNT